jgi:phage gp46-like protein
MGAEAVLHNGEEAYDFRIDSNGDIETADQLDTALLMSLFCEARASASEMQPPELRRGWIGNLATPGVEIGSKIWLYEQARLTRSTLNGIVAEARSALAWMIEDDIALKIEADMTLDGLAIILTRPNSEVLTRFYRLWEGTGRAY